MSQQLSLRAECLITHRAGEVRQPVLKPVGISVFGRLKHLVTPAAGEAAFVQVRLLVIGQTGQVMELLVTLATMVDGAGAVAALVRQQLGFGFEDGVTLETRVGPGGAGLREGGLRGAGLFFRSTLQVHSSSLCQGRAARLIGTQVTDHLETGTQLS